MPAEWEPRQLFERAAEEAWLVRRYRGLADGHGGVVALRGAAGIGKTELLRRLLDTARHDGAHVLPARAGEVERGLPFGVLRQLLAPAVLGLSPTERAELQAGPANAALLLVGADEVAAPAGADAVAYGMYWLLATLGERAPVVVAVDDLHWADGPSVRFLDFLARRVDHVAVLAAVTLREGEPSVDPAAVDRVLASPATEVVDLRPLSRSGVGELAARMFDVPADPRFVQACHAATGGNPLFVQALLSEFAERGVEPGPDAAAHVGEYGPKRLGSWLRARMLALGADAEAIATAVGVLGHHATLRSVAALTSLPLERVATATDRLVAADVLAADGRLVFAHPILHQVALTNAGDQRTRLLHRTAADILQAEGEPPEDVANHARLAPPAGDADVVTMLQRGAAAAAARGAPDAAAAYLRRALDEPPPADRRSALLRELGRLQLATGDGAAVATLRDARSAAADGVERAAAALPLMHALIGAGEIPEALALVVEALSELGDADRELMYALEAEAATWVVRDVPGGSWVVERVEQHAQEATGATPGERLLLANLAFSMVLTGRGSAEECAHFATTAYADGRLLEDVTADAPSVAAAVTSFAHADRLDLADEAVTRALAEASQRGSALGFGYASVLQAGVAERHGRFPEMEAAARSALELADLNDWQHLQPMALHFLAIALLGRGAVDEADELLTRYGWGPGTPPTPLPPGYTRAVVRLRQQRYGEAVDDILQARAAGAWWMGGTLMPWRSDAARAMHGLGREHEARSMAEEELDLARSWGTAWCLGIALRGLGLVSPDRQREALLREAVEVTAGTSAVLPRARALADLGATLRRTGQRAAAQPPLREAAELAIACGAQALLDVVNDELSAAGAPRARRPVAGVDSLTPTQRRIAGMAAAGRTNRQIAQELFVSLKTVESHLAVAFRKLQVTSRGELSDALAGGGSEPR